jgi:RNA polymerase sigma-70 factor (ECF subfamily)
MSTIASTANPFPVLQRKQIASETLTSLYDQYLDQIYNYVFYRVGNTQDAEDLTEMVFLKAFEYLSRSKSGKKLENARAWIFRIAHNLVVDHYRTKKSYTSIDDDFLIHSSDPQPETAFQQKEEFQGMIKALKSLDPTFQQVLICRFIDGLSHRETARIMNIKENHVRILQFRALKKVRALLNLH